MALRGVRVLELAGLAPVPFCGMMLADFGADVIRVDKAFVPEIDTKLGRGKKSIALNLKHPQGRALLTNLAAKSDVLIEPYRAGVMEKLGLGPNTLMEKNPRLIYARLTGYGSKGPLSSHAGHDINFLSYSGILWALGARFPINLLGDFAGGSLMCSFAIVAALFQRSVTGRGQVVDVNMTQGAAYVGSWLWRSRHTLPFAWTNPTEPGKNLLDGGRAFYTTYKTKDGGHVAVGALEPQFFDALLKALNVSDPDSFDQMGDQEKLRSQFEAIFEKHDLKHWAKVAENNPNACLSPLLTLDNVAEHQHSKDAKSFIRQPKEIGGGFEPAPVPFALSAFGQSQESANEPLVAPPDPKVGQHTRSVLSTLGLSNIEIDELQRQNVVQCEEEDEKDVAPRPQAKL